MGEVRACVYISVIFLCFQISVAKPFFFGDGFWCDWLCDDDDILSATTSSNNDDLCSDCPLSIPRPPTTLAPLSTMPPNPGMMQGQPINLMIPPANGMNLTLVQNNGGWGLNFVPWSTSPGGPAGVTPAPAAATTAAVAAAGAAAGAAAAVTTVAPTTVAAGK